MSFSIVKLLDQEYFDNLLREDLQQECLKQKRLEHGDPDPELDHYQLFEYAKNSKIPKQTRSLCNVYFVRGNFFNWNFKCTEKTFFLPSGKSKDSLPKIYNPRGPMQNHQQVVYIKHGINYKKLKAQREKEKNAQKHKQRHFTEE